MKPFQPLPEGKGSSRLESPPGEGIQEFFFRYMKRKEAKTGWKSGKAEQRDTRHIRGEVLERPFIALLDALVEAGFAENWGEAREALRLLASHDSRVGLSEKAGSMRYWIRQTDRPDDF
jgi:hypothetical protein